MLKVLGFWLGFTDHATHTCRLHELVPVLDDGQNGARGGRHLDDTAILFLSREDAANSIARHNDLA